MTKLKPCPFCGGEPIAYEIPPHNHMMVNLPSYEGGAFVECPRCSTVMAGSTKEAVIETWNRRSREAAGHAQWLRDESGRLYCSACGSYSDRESNFCPAFGEKMDRGDNGE